ncbi:glycosyltransferase family 4 protein [Shouchella shacheensis]|uniref:glycosyltransferase family 4 protein n=1 Tax=Shouchella shacheensis TaxID=1649580 RepID=UPI00073FCF5F|nr:glycosyltransferase family 4 protein [Shouchella shacheensis]
MERKILHITTIDFTIDKMLIDKMVELSKYNNEVDLLSSDVGFQKKIKEYGYRHINTNIERTISPMADFKSLVTIYRFLKWEKYDVVHTHTAKAGFVGRVAAKLAGVKVVCHTSHGLPFFEGQSRVKNAIYYTLEKVASWFSNGYFSQNYEDLEAIKNLVPKKVLTGYEGNGVPLNKLDAYPQLTEEQKEEYQNAFNISDNDFTFLVGARFESIKNHHLLLNALKQIPEEKRNFKVLLAGLGGPLEEEIKRLVKEYGLEERVLFLGYRDDVYELIQVSDAIMLTSRKEGIPRMLMEAMAFSKPVLATNVLGTRELVVHQETGEMVEDNSVDELKQAIEAWIDPASKERLKSYAEKGRKHIEDHFTEAIVASRINDFYKKLESR